MGNEQEIDDLEAQVRSWVADELQKQTESMPVSRRGILAGALGLGAGTLGTYGAVGRASAQSSGAGYIGSDDRPVEEIYAESLNVDTVASNVDHQGYNIANVGSLGASSATVENEMSAGSVSTDDASVENAPSGSTDVVRKNELDGLVIGPLDADDIRGSRSEGTEYQNTSGSPLYLTTSATCSTDEEILLSVMVGDESGLTSASNLYSRVWYESGVRRVTVHALIPDGYYYEVSEGRDGAVEEWFEQELDI